MFAYPSHNSSCLSRKWERERKRRKGKEQCLLIPQKHPKKLVGKTPTPHPLSGTHNKERRPLISTTYPGKRGEHPRLVSVMKPRGHHLSSANVQQILPERRLEATECQTVTGGVWNCQHGSSVCSPWRCRTVAQNMAVRSLVAYQWRATVARKLCPGSMDKAG